MSILAIRHPDRSLEVSPPFIDRERLETVPHVCAEPGLVEGKSLGAKSRTGDSKRTNGVPNADAFDGPRLCNGEAPTPPDRPDGAPPLG
jgi:hypothetical protein